MNKIEIKVLNPKVVRECENMMVFGARLTQKGHNIHNMNDLMELYNKSYTEKTMFNMIDLPHDTIKRFGVINIAVVGASRRFLAQITRHQVGVTFMSASLQYSNYSGNSDFVVPYEIMKKGEFEVNRYLDICKEQMSEYEHAVQMGIDHDAAGYMAPQGLRNILIISANPVAWKHMISLRGCRRNTLETEYIMLRIWEELLALSPLFKNSGPDCTTRMGCRERGMSCRRPMKPADPSIILKEDFPLLYTEYNKEKEDN